MKTAPIILLAAVILFVALTGFTQHQHLRDVQHEVKVLELNIQRLSNQIDLLKEIGVELTIVDHSALVNAASEKGEEE